MWHRTSRRTMLLGWLLFLGVVAYLGTHPRLLAPLATRIITRDLFRGRQGSLRVRDFQGSFLSGAELHQVALSLRGERGSAVFVSVDTLVLDYRIRELLAKPPRLRGVTVRGLTVRALGPARGGDGGGRGGRGAGSPPVVLPPMTIDQLVAGGSLEIAGPDGRLRERIASLLLRATVKADSAGALTVDLRQGDVDWVTRATQIAGAHGVLRADRFGVTVSGLELALDGHPIALDGRRGWDGRAEMRLDARGIAVPEIERLLATRIGVKAEGDVAVTIGVRPDTLAFDGTFAGRLEDYDLQPLRARGTAARQTIDWSYLAGTVNGVSFAGSGRFDIRDPHRPAFTIMGDVADVDLSRGLVPKVKLPPTAGSGWVRIDRRGATDETAVTGWLANGRLAAVPFDTCRVDVLAQHGAAELRMIDLRYRSQEARLSGVADASGEFDGHIEFTAGSLEDLPPTLRWPRLGGSLRASGSVRGRDPSFRFEGEGTLRGFSLAPLRADSCRVTAVVEDLLGSPRVSGRAAGSGLAIGGMRMGDFALHGSVSPSGAVLESFRSQVGGSTVTLDGEAKFAAGSADIKVGRLEVDFEGTRWQTAAPIQLHTGPQALQVDEFVLSSDLGSLRASGAYDRAAERLTGACRFQRFDLRLLNQVMPQRKLQLNGEVSAQVDISGTPSAPVLAIAADLTRSHFEKADVDSLHLAARYAEGALSIAQLEMRTNYGRVTAKGSVSNPAARRLGEFWPGAALELDLGVQKGDWAFIDQFHIPALKRIKGMFAGTFHVAGTTRQPLVDGQIVSEPFNVHWLHLQRLEGRLGLTSTRLTLSELVGVQQAMRMTGRIEVPLRADFLSAPATPLDGPLLMQFRIPDGTDMAPLAAATNAFLSSSGTGGMDLTIAGPLRHPLFHGTVRIQKGGCVLKGLEEVYHDVSATGVWEGDELRLADLTGGEGARGTFSGTGTLRFFGLLLTGFEVDLKADRFLVASVPDLRALVRSDEILITGVKVGPDSVMVPKFSGNLEIVAARYTGDFSEKPTVTDVRVATVAPDWLADLHMIGPPRTALITNRAMELAMSGDFDLIRDQEGLYLRGSMDIDSGHMPVFNNDFQVAQGRLEFTESGIVPRVNLTAETTIRVPYEGPYTNRNLEKITATVTGTIDRPTVDFSSESGYSRTNIERMLLGLTPNAADQLTTQELAGTSIAAGLNLVEREIAGEIGVIDTFDINSSRDLETGSYRTQIGVGKYLGQDLYVKYAQSLSEPDRDLLIEYQISDHLLLQSEVSRQVEVEQASTMYNLDLKYRFEY